MKVLLLLLLVTFVQSIVSTITTVVCVFNDESKIPDNVVLARCTSNYSNLSQALEYYRYTSSISFLLQSGVHELNPSNLSFNNIRNLNIASMEPGQEGKATIECQPQSGLAFFNSQNISLANIDFTGCRMLHENIVVDTYDQFTNVSLYFLNCSDITFDTVTVSNSTGIALFIDSASGSNFINNSHFLYNQLVSNDKGGGIVITYVMTHNLSSVSWTISNSTFKWNEADVNEKDIKKIVYPSDLHHGHGGGLLLRLAGISSSNFTFDSCVFEGNKALYGGGAFVTLGHGSKNNTILFLSITFLDNTAIQGGGGARIFLHTSIELNRIEFNNCHFLNNRAGLGIGGGISIFTTLIQNNTNSIVMADCIWNSNTAKTGSAVGITAWLTVNGGASLPKLRFVNCSFFNNSNNSVSDTAQFQPQNIGTVYLDSVPVTFDDVRFLNNYATAIYAVNAKLEFAENSTALFYRNSGNNGGAIALIGSAAIVVNENSSFNFTENSATVHGAAIYAFITSQHHDMVSINCFIQYFDPNSKPSEWKTSFYFHDNNVGKKNETIFATTLDYCAWESKDKKKTPLFCTAGNIWQFQPNSSCEERLKTLPAEILVSSDISVLPGMTTTMNLTATDDLGNEVSSYVMTADSNLVHVDEDYGYISDNRIKLSKIHASAANDSNQSLDYVTLHSIFPRVLEVNLPVQFEDCPIGYYLNEEGICDCNEHNFSGIIRCQKSTFSAMIRKGYWIGKYDHNGKNVTAVGPCRFCDARLDETHGGFVTLPKSYEELDDVLCGGDKGGTLCTSCKNKSYALTVIGYGCMDCSKRSAAYTWLVFVVTQVLPVTVLFLVLLMTNFPLASGYLNGAIFFAQTISTSLDISGNGEIPMQNITKVGKDTELLTEIYDVLYNIWNLDFIEPVQYCLAPHLSMNIVFVSEYLVAFFPILFVLLIFFFHFVHTKTTFCVKLGNCLCSLYHINRCYEKVKNKWNKYIEGYGQFRREKALKNVLASCIILAYTRCALNTCYILYPGSLYSSNGDVVATVPFFDASTKYAHGTSHLISVIVAVAVSLFFLLPVPLILFFGRHNPSVQVGRNTYLINAYLNILLEAFQQDFKSGEDPNNDPQLLANFPRLLRLYKYLFVDMRWVSSLYFIMRLALALAFILPYTFLTQILIQQVVICVMIFIIVVFQPYQKNVHNQIDTCIFLLITVINTITLYQYSLFILMEDLSLSAFIIQYILVYLPMIWIGIFIVWKMIGFCCRARRRRKEYQEIPPVNS